MNQGCDLHSSKHKTYMYNICTMLDQRRRQIVQIVQGRHCTNVIQMFRVYWDAALQSQKAVSAYL